MGMSMFMAMASPPRWELGFGRWELTWFFC